MKMTKRRNDEAEEEKESIPLPIQTFLWRQTSPFIRPKFGKQQDALAMEQREACKSFEKVLVQNIQFGLSPSLTDAIKSISRWKLIQASLPHVMHCCSALLYNRKNSSLDKLGAAETKLLYTLHWIVLDAAEECADAEAEQGINRPVDHYLLPITTIELFVYLFSPLITYLKNSDFLTSFRLENGHKLWGPLFNYQHPDIPSFVAQVKPKRNILRASRFEGKFRPKFGDVFIGADDKIERGNRLQVKRTEKLTSPVHGSKYNEAMGRSSIPPLASKENAHDDKSEIRKEIDGIENKRLLEPMMATYLDVATLRCLFTSQWLEEGIHWSLNYFIKRLKSIQKQINELDYQRPRSSSLPIQSISLFNYGLESSMKIEYSGANYDPCLFPTCLTSSSRVASFAELRRSSFSGIGLNWGDSGNGSSGGGGGCGNLANSNSNSNTSTGLFRGSLIRGVSGGSKRQKTRETPKNIVESTSSIKHHNDQSNEQSFSPYLHHTSNSIQRKNNQSLGDKSPSINQHSVGKKHDGKKPHPPRPKSALGFHGESDSTKDSKWCKLKFELIRGKSMPSLHLFDSDKHGSDSPSLEKVSHLFDSKLSFKRVTSIGGMNLNLGDRGGGESTSATGETSGNVGQCTFNVPNPIITVTEHSPVASVQFFINQDTNDSIREDDRSGFGGRSICYPPCRQYSITRSQTDSNITYFTDPSNEAPGSVHYIARSGQLSLLVILKAVHSVSLRDNVCSKRVCEGIISILDSLITMGLLHNYNAPDPPDMLTSTFDGSPNTIQKLKLTSSEELNVYQIFLDTVLKVYRNLGCPYSCHEGHTSGQSESGRKEIVDMLTLLYHTSETEFNDFLKDMVVRRPLQEVIDTFHAFLGFCSERSPIISPNSSTRNRPVNGLCSGLSTGPALSTGGLSAHLGNHVNKEHGRTGYANNFGAGFKRIGSSGVEGVIIGCVFNSLITRLVGMEKELKAQENMSMYCDIRQLIGYIRDNHGGTFRRVALSGLLESLESVTTRNKSAFESGRPLPGRSGTLGKTSGSEPDVGSDLRTAYTPSPFMFTGTPIETVESEKHSSNRKSFFRKKNSNVGIKKAPSNQSIVDEYPNYTWPGGGTGAGTNTVNAPISVGGDGGSGIGGVNLGTSNNLPSSHSSTPALLKINRSASPRMSITDDDLLSQKSSKMPVGQMDNKNEFNLVNWLKGDRSGKGVCVGTGQPEGFLHQSEIQSSGLGIISNCSQGPSVLAGPISALYNESILNVSANGDKLSRRSSFQNRTPKMVGKSASHVGSTFLKARKRMEDQFKNVFGKGKNKQGSFEDNLDTLKRRDSFEIEGNYRAEETISYRDNRLICMPAIRNGMIKFSFLLETCAPGTLPDPPLIAAVLDIKAPVLARAAFFLECAHFVHRCNKGSWPSWMKLNFPIFRPGTAKSGSGSCLRDRASQSLHRNAGRMFYLWAEALGAHIEEIIFNEKNVSKDDESNANLDENKRKQFRSEDENEEFLIESTTVGQTGNDCPFSLKMSACCLLLEITTFLRETHQYLPNRASKSSIRQPSTFETRTMTANRRWSMALSSLGFSQTSAHSLMSLAEQNYGQPLHGGERRISFVLHEADGENNSDHSSNTTVTGTEGDHTGQGVNNGPGAGNFNEPTKSLKRSSQSSSQAVRPNLLRRATGTASNSPHNGSFKRRSIKLKRNQADRRPKRASTMVPEDDEDSVGLTSNLIQRADSLKSRRKVSGISEKSDTSERADVSGEESPGVMSDDGQNCDPSDMLSADDTEITHNMPWLKVIINVINSLDFECSHKNNCTVNCYHRSMRSCSKLIKVIRKVYEEPNDTPSLETIVKVIDDKEDALKKEKKFKKIITGPSSPLRRKLSSSHNADRYVDRDNFFKTHSLHSSTGFLSHHDVEAGTGSGCADPWKRFGSDKLTCQSNPSLIFINNHVKNLFHTSISALIKGFLNLSSPSINSLLSLSWKMILETDQDVRASCSVAFIISAVRSPDYASKLLADELSSEDPSNRIKAINKFYAIWRARHQCWQRMEEGAHLTFKVPPPVIEFTLPSPKIALPTMPVADPPWMPPTKSKVEEVTISQEQVLQKSFVTATKTRRKQQIELVHKVLQDEEAKLREERESYRISSIPTCNEAAYEPALFRADEPEEGDEDVAIEKPASHHKQVAQAIFPSCLCSAAITIINLLNDPQVSCTGSAIYEVAYKVVWHCLVEDTSLFLRHLFEKLTREGQQMIFQILRRLIRFMPRLPAQAAYTLYNYLIGFIMFYVRSPIEGSQEMIGTTLSVLWLVIPSVHGLFLKDLKQVLRKEQCDATLLITANVPSAKKVIVHSNDAATIPSQFPIHEDTQFYQVLIDSLDTMNIDLSLVNEYYLVDTKTNQMHNLNAYVRDFYFFKRSQYPQLSLVRMNPNEAYEKLQDQAFKLQFVELGKTLMSLSIVKSQYLAIQRVLFLHEELMKLPAFPRKALEANFNLYKGSMGKQMLGMDTLHKIVWVKLVSRMLEVTSGFFAQSADIHLFLNVVNGGLVLHCEDAAVLRLSMATFLNAAHQFKNIFSTNGYLLIMPTLLRIYSNHQTNGLLCRTIEFVCKQFYILHRKPFILQMFGSAAPILDIDSTTSIGDASRIQPKAFFQLLQSLGQYIVDPLDILELVDTEKPLKALDFCYQMDPEALTILDAVSLCVTVAAYAADSQRGHQMLTILETILPLFMKHMQNLTMKKETPGGPKTELQMIHNISVCIKTLIRNCEALTRNFTGPQRAIDLRGSSMKNTSRGAYSPPIDVDEDSHSKFMGENYFPTRSRQQHADEDADTIRADFRRPRDTLLNIVTEFLTRSAIRLADLSKKVPDLHQKNSSYELLDVKCHLRLAEVAHSLLKVSPYDPQTMACRGLVRYMNEVLPNSEWRQESMRPALIMILRRLDKMFNKIAKQGAVKRLTDWEAAKRLLKGVYSTFIKHPYIVHLPHLKSLIAVGQNIILGDSGNSGIIGDNIPSQSSWAMALSQSPPPGFCSVAVRLIAMQLLQLGETQTLETLCSGAFSSPEKTEIYLLNMIYPMCIRISGGLNNLPKLRPCDITFILSVILNSLNPSSSKPGGGSGSKSAESSSLLSNPAFQPSLQQIGLLGLKIMIVCFERQLSNDWYRIARCIRENANKNLKGVTFWNFIDFVVTHRTPLFVLLLPLIRYKLLQKICNYDQEYFYQHQIRCKLEGQNMPHCRSRGQLLVCLFAELRGLKEDLVAKKMGIDEKTKSSHGIGHRPSFTLPSSLHPGVARGQPAASSSQASAEEASDYTVDSQSGTVTSQPKRPSLLRGLSFRIDRTNLNRGTSVKLPVENNDKGKLFDRFIRRTSYPSNPVETGTKSEKPEEKPEQTQSEPRLFRKSTAEARKLANRREQMKKNNESNSLEDESSSRKEDEKSESSDQDASKTGLISSEIEDPDRPKHRLQRQKAQSRKTFRFRKSRKGAGFLHSSNETDGTTESSKGDPILTPTTRLLTSSASLRIKPVSRVITSIATSITPPTTPTSLTSQSSTTIPSLSKKHEKKKDGDLNSSSSKNFDNSGNDENLVILDKLTSIQSDHV